MNWILRHPTAVLILAIVLLVVGLLGVGVYVVIRPRKIVARAQANLPAEGFDHQPFAALLGRFVAASGEVDYAAWHADPSSRDELERYLANLAAASPKNAPERFPEASERLAYYLNAYNACVIVGVLRHWPLKTVHEVVGPAELKAGFGFFARLQFNLGGEWMSLHHLEQGLIRVEYTDPRVHFLLNCASTSCPPIRPELPSGPDLEDRLATAAREFVNDPRQVRIDVAEKRVRVSSIFVWYEADFLAELKRRGLPPAEQTLIRYLKDLAAPPLAEQLGKARAEGYVVEAIDYDWSLNGS
ncbi:MAG: DUF547 domain-containing protein [Planctomycetes bacterium]|nr:DUF547 domain-containing protein [Planctomycetota bacterium]